MVDTAGSLGIVMIAIIIAIAIGFVIINIVKLALMVIIIIGMIVE